MQVSVTFDWRRAGRVQLGTDGKLEFPKLPLDPGIYLFRLVGHDDSSIYVGESDNLSRRAAHYRNPGPRQKTNIRMNTRLLDHLLAGRQAEVSYLTAAEVEIDGARQDLDFIYKAARLLVESAALVAAKREGLEAIENL